MRLLLTFVLASLANHVAGEEFWEAKVDAVMKACEVDLEAGDEIDEDAFTCIIYGKLSMQPSYTAAGMDIGTEYTTAGGGNTVSKTEFIDYMLDVQTHLQEEMIANLVGVAAAVPDTAGLATVDPSVLAADFKVSIELTLKKDPSDFFKGDLDAFKTTLMNVFDPDGEWITVDNFVFQLRAGSAVMTGTAFAPDEGSATAAETNLMDEMGDKDSASSLLGEEVTSDPTIAVTPSTPALVISPTNAIIVGIAAVFSGIITCFLAKRSSKTRRAAWGTDYSSCCSTGCCSGYGLKGWAQGNVLAAIIVIASTIPMYVQMNVVAEGLTCIIDNVLALGELGGDAAAVVEALPVSILELIKPQVGLLGLASILPAALAAVFMILTSGCGYRTSSSMCCTKLFALITHVLLILSAVLYIVFAALGVVVTLEFAQPILKTITGICDTKIPILGDLAQGAADGLELAKSQGAVPQELQDAVDIIVPTYEIFEATCGCLVDLLFELAALVAPGATAAVASFYGLYSVHGLCCAANCCYSPVGAGKSGDGATISKGDEAVQDV